MFAPGDKLDWKRLGHTQSNRCLDLLSFLLFLFVVRVVERGWTRAVRSDLFSNGSLSVVVVDTCRVCGAAAAGAISRRPRRRRNN